MMRRRFISYLLIAALLLTGYVTAAPQKVSAAGNTYYVDGVNGSDTTGTGSTGSPWKTISKAASIMTAGDTAKIRTGVYRETVKPTNSGTPGNEITFQPDTGADVTISGANLVTGSWSVHSGSIYKASATLPMGDYLDSVYVDGIANNLARSPNTAVGNLYDPALYQYNNTSNRGLLVDSANLTQAAGYWDNASVFVEDSGEWNFSNALATTYTPGNLNLKTSQNAYSLKFSTYDNTLKLLGVGGAVLGSYNVTIAQNTTYNLKVTTSGSTINVYLNNGASPVITATDTNLKEGSFGLGVESNSSATAAKAEFTNVNATIASQDPNQATGREAASFTSNIKGWYAPEASGYWKPSGATLLGYTQPQTSGTTAWYESTTTAKDFTYSADVKLTSAGTAYLVFRKEMPPGSVIDLSNWGYGAAEYFIMGKLAALDYPGEWYYDKTAGQLYLRTTASNSPASHTVEYKARNLAFDLSGKSNIVIKNVKLFAAAIDTTDGSNNVIDGINAKYVSEFNRAITYSAGVCLCGTNNTLKNSELQYSSGAIVTIEGDNNKLINNSIHDGTYGPIVFNSVVDITGRGHLISHNTVYNSGRSLIGGEFFATVIQYNDFHHGNYFAKDTGMLYTAHNDLGNSEIHHNFWHDSVSRANADANGSGGWTGGIYLDESSANALVYKNVTWNLSWVGVIVNHLSDYVMVYNNTTHNFSGIRISEPTYGIDAYKDRIANNIALQEFGTGASAIGAVFSNNMTSGSPLYVNTATNDFQLQSGSGAKDIGLPIRGITDGFTGTAPDAGAYEYGGASWTAGHNFASPPSPAYQLVDTDYKNLVVNGSLDMNRMRHAAMDSLYGWTKTNSQTAQPAYDYAGGKVSSRFTYETGASLGSGADGIEQTITGLTPNTTYELSGYLRAGSSGQTVRLGVKNYGGSDTYQENTTTSWVNKTFTFTTGAANTSATIYGLKPTTGGYAFVDDVMMSATTALSGSDTTAPSAPTSLAVASVTDTTASLTWTASTDNVGVTGYIVYRNGVQVGTPTGTGFTDTGLTASTTYTYTVKATDAATNLSAASSSVNATTSAGSSGYSENFESTTIGQMPAGWTVNTAGGAVSVQQVADGANTTNRALTLTQSSANYGVADVSATKSFSAATGSVTIDMRMKANQTSALTASPVLSNSSGTPIVQLGFRDNGKFAYVSSSMAWTDTTMTYAANQWYDVHIVVNLTAGTFSVTINGTAVLTNVPVMASSSNLSQINFSSNMWYTGIASYDNIQVGTGDTQAPTAPTGLTAASVTASTASLTWTASTDNVGVTGYKVYRNGTEVGTASGTGFTDSGLTANTTYAYTVKAYDAATNLSAPSGSVNAKTNIFAELFDTTTIGQMPAGWTVGTSGGGASVQQVADGANTTNRALTLTQSNYGIADVSAVKSFTSASGTVTIDTRMKANQTNALIAGPVLLNSSGTPIVQFAFRENGKFGYVSSSIAWTDTSMSYAANQWYDVRLVVNLTAGTFNLSINGTSVLTNVPVMASATSVSQISYVTNMWYSGVASFDKIQISQ
nr:fibronectin type III domain-containing protein [Paenibacillus lignilyticus]